MCRTLISESRIMGAEGDRLVVLLQDQMDVCVYVCVVIVGVCFLEFELSSSAVCLFLCSLHKAN